MHAEANVLRLIVYLVQRQTQSYKMQENLHLKKLA